MAPISLCCGADPVACLSRTSKTKEIIFTRMTHTTHDAETTPSWDPAQYLKFANERFRAAVELLERVPITSPRTIVDLGCGTGEITRLIANHWPTASVTGIDESESMLDMARAHAPGINWQRRSIDDWRPNQSFDLIYANATLQWLADHNTLIPRLIGCLHSRWLLGDTNAAQLAFTIA